MLALFLKDPAWVKAAQEKNIGPEDFIDGITHQVVEQFGSWPSRAGEWSTHDLLVRLNDETAQSLVTKLISIEEGKLGDTALVFQDCIGKIQKEKQKKKRPVIGSHPSGRSLAGFRKIRSA